MAGEGREFWEGLLRAAPYHGTVEKLRDAIDVTGWRQIEAAAELAEERRGEAPREVAESFGTTGRRRYRQVNVKLAEVDFDVLRALAVEMDVAPSTLARTLLRKGLLAEAERRAASRPPT